MRERHVISQIAALTGPSSHPLLVQGIGDDCAVLSGQIADDHLVTTDMLVEGVHFDCRWHPAHLLGRKSLAVSVSDIAAMGGEARFALLSLALPSRLGDAWIAEFIEGFVSKLAEEQVILIGGDTVGGDKLVISVTVLGGVAQGKAIKRQGARPGDGIYVTGPLGLAAAALHLCQNQCFKIEDVAMSPWPNLLKALLDPEAQSAMGMLLGSFGGVSAMQDISDGIATDLAHICQASRVAAEIFADCLAPHPDLENYCRLVGLNPIDLQLRGGEDYQLLFTMPPRREPALFLACAAESLPEPQRIGVVREGAGIWLRQGGAATEITFQGYEHRS
ncbi:MAG: thiamine-phosphate kinase [Desulfobulbaceae bacterium]|jgi:thiamine-monophosphate kinase|nr:thiamine-phosphate kinase [Desulfobulbaceae bacterium]